MSTRGGKTTPTPPITPSPSAQYITAQDHPPTSASPVAVPSFQKVPTYLTVFCTGSSAHPRVASLCQSLTSPVTPFSLTYKPLPSTPRSHYNFRIPIATTYPLLKYFLYYLLAVHLVLFASNRTHSTSPLLRTPSPFHTPFMLSPTPPTPSLWSANGQNTPPKSASLFP